MVMCVKHWKMLTAKLRHAIYEAYVPGAIQQQPEFAWAVKEATDYIAKAEREFSIKGAYETSAP